jgi:hypothetical protein
MSEYSNGKTRNAITFGYIELSFMREALSGSWMSIFPNDRQSDADRYRIKKWRVRYCDSMRCFTSIGSPLIAPESVV